MHHEGMDPHSYNLLCAELTKASEGLHHDVHPRTHVKKAWASNVQTAAIYMRHVGMKGCVTKTLIGLDCYQVHTLTMQDAEQAATRLRKFRFVGILEEWTESLLDFMWLNSHESRDVIQLDEMLTSVHRSGDHVLVNEIKDKVDYEDPFDGLLYKVAQEISSEQRKLRLEGKARGRNAGPC
jgi:hypothetical protein